MISYRTRRDIFRAKWAIQMVSLNTRTSGVELANIYAGDDKPNKKYFDPRVWVREGEKTMSKRIAEALDDFATAGKL